MAGSAAALARGVDQSAYLQLTSAPCLRQELKRFLRAMMVPSSCSVESIKKKTGRPRVHRTLEKFLQSEKTSCVRPVMNRRPAPHDPPKDERL